MPARLAALTILWRAILSGRANHVWGTDITYIPMAHGWVYLVAIVDWASRRVLAHRVSISTRRQAVEPAIGHLKSDHRMDRCWLRGAVGDALHALSCAAGYNLRWLLRAIPDLRGVVGRVHVPA